MDFNLGVNDKPKEKKTGKIKQNVTYDIIILGGGPAGIAAGIYAMRKGLNCALITKDFGGQMNWTSSVENYPGFSMIDAFQLIDKFKSHLEEYPVDLLLGEEINKIEKVNNLFTVKVANGKEYIAKTVIIATGKRSRELGLDNEKRLRGKGVSYCATCDGPLFRGKKVVVVGGGNSGVEALIDMQNIASELYVVNNKDDFTADKILVEKLDLNKVNVFNNHVVSDVLGEQRLEKVKVKNLKTGEESVIDADGIFIEIGLIPNTEFIEDFITKNKWGEIEIKSNTQTNIPGIFACGDVTNVTDKQIVIAAGEGAKAALAAYDYLLRS